MKENKDKYEVHLSREMYDALVAWAKVGEEHSYQLGIDAPTPLVDIDRHVRKYNEPLREKSKEVREAEKRLFAERKKAVYDFVNANAGKQVWWLHRRGDRGRSYALLPIQVLSVSDKDKTKVKLKQLSYGSIVSQGTRVHLDLSELMSELPEGAVVFRSGEWSGSARWEKPYEKD